MHGYKGIAIAIRMYLHICYYNAETDGQQIGYLFFVFALPFADDFSDSHREYFGMTLYSYPNGWVTESSCGITDIRVDFEAIKAACASKTILIARMLWGKAKHVIANTYQMVSLS